MQEIILIIGLVAYGLFLGQFILSLFGYDSDIDLDLDFDGDADLSLSDLVSFKGLIHFIMGSTSYLYSQLYFGYSLTILSWIVAAVVGIVFVIGLYYVYKGCMKLQHTTKRETDLSGRPVTIIRHVQDNQYVGSTSINGAYEMFDVTASFPLAIGEQYKITEFINNKIYI